MLALGYKDTLSDLSLLFTAAGDAYKSAAELHRDKLDTRHEAANNFADAAAVYKKVKPEGTAQHTVTITVLCVTCEVILITLHYVFIYRGYKVLSNFL